MPSALNPSYPVHSINTPQTHPNPRQPLLPPLPPQPRVIQQPLDRRRALDLVREEVFGEVEGESEEGKEDVAEVDDLGAERGKVGSRM